MTKFLPVLVVVALLPLVTTRPTGAGGCSRNMNGSVGGSHLSAANQTTGKLEDNNLAVVISETTPEAGETLVEGDPYNVTVGVDYNVYLSSSDADGFRGFLFRLESQDGTDTTIALATATGEAQLAQDTCIDIENVGGITHTGNDFKTGSSAVLRMDKASPNMILSVTAVISCRDGVSEWYFTEYTLNAVGGDGTSAAAYNNCVMSIGWIVSGLLAAAGLLV